MSQTVRVRVRIAAPPEPIFQALTNADQLEVWFAEEADISAAERRYDFWGCYTPGNPDRKAGRHQLLSVDAGRSLSYAWRLRDADTVVAISLTPVGDETIVEVLHRNLPPRPLDGYSVADFWSLTVENLRGWVERATVGARCDYSAPPCGEVAIGVDIEAPAATVYAALTEPAQLNRYMAEHATVEPHPGGRYSFGWESGGPIKIVDLVPNETLSYEWNQGEPEITLVTWSLEGSAGRTRLTLRHSGFSADHVPEDYRAGWLNFLNRVKFLCETGERWVAPELEEVDHSHAETAAD